MSHSQLSEGRFIASMSTTYSTRSLREHACRPPNVHLDIILPNSKDSQALGQRGVPMVYQLKRYGHVRTTCRLKSASDLLAGGVRGISMNFNCNTTWHVDISLVVIPSHCNLHTKARTRQSLLGPSKANQIVQISIWLPPRSCRPTNHYLDSRVIALS